MLMKRGQLLQRKHIPLPRKIGGIGFDVPQAPPGKVIAQRLNISEHTLRNHLTSIYRKLSVSNRAELHAYVNRHGLERLS